MTDRESGKRDWRISAVLIAVWSITNAVILSRGTEIPTSMILLASTFFVFLLPSMHDLVISIEKKIGRGAQSSKPVEGNSNER
ncbi:MAG: hypothetical protein OSB26_01775 [Woeseiaceae bacterium]|jgi:hypothetical protein|nr:hypothetical protein [Woeseiaceae bacterium]